MTRSVLDTHRPERLVDELDEDSLLEAVLAVDAWSERTLDTVDYVLRHWTAQFAARQDARSVAALQSMLGTIVERRPPPEPYSHRWRALDDTLEARRLTLAARDPERVTGLKHVGPILDYLREAGPVRQGDLREMLGLGISVSRLSQIVSLMEANGLVEVERRGRERFIRAAAEPRARGRAEAVVPAPAREPTTRSLLRRTA